MVSGALLAFGFTVAARPGSGHALRAHVGATMTTRYVYPLKVSSNRRYLVDQRGRPFMIVGDSPQALIGNLSIKDAAGYIANRKAAGFNSLIVDVLCAKYTGCRSDGTTISGIAPLTTPGDLSTPNPTYFAHVDAIVRLAAKAGIVVFLDPIETGGWLSVLRSNGAKKDYAYGRFLGARYKRFENIVWLSGNDFQSWSNRSDDAVVLAVAKGIASVDHAHIQTIELNFSRSASLDDPRWRSVIRLDAAYTYYPTYAEVQKEYDRSGFMPVVMIEAGYEFEQNSSSISYGDPATLRRQEYWSVLAGATGQFYGNHFTWEFADGWKQHLDTIGSRQFGYLVTLFAGQPWFRLVPDQKHLLVTAGYGQPTADGNVDSSDYVTAAATPDGTFAVAYLPTAGTITVDLARLKRSVDASWYDPTTGTSAPAQGAPVGGSGAAQFTAPGKNAEGDSDWLLVLTAT
jgi:Protein of unknown function (DUF4038)/Putative collagen-binding domain of a collagenase